MLVKSWGKMMDDQIKPVDWAESHGLKVDVVMKLLRDAGVVVRSHMSKVDAKDYEIIEIAAEIERQKAIARKKNLEKSTETDLAQDNPISARIKNFLARVVNRNDNDNDASKVCKETEIGMEKPSSTSNSVEVELQKKSGDGMGSKTNAAPTFQKKTENVIKSSPSLDVSQKAELGDKILGIITSANPAGTWCTLANVEMLLGVNGVSYSDFGFEKLNQFLNEFAEYFDFRQTPSPKEGAPAIPELRVKTAVAENMTKGSRKVADADTEAAVVKDFQHNVHEGMDELEEGKVVTGKITFVDDNEVLVDVNYKMAGVVDRYEFKKTDTLEIGSEIEVFVEKLEDADGRLILSKQKADYVRTWDRIHASFEKNETVQGTVTKRISGGLVINLWGVETFLPGSQSDLHSILDMNSLIGQTLDLKIIRVNKARGNVIVSRSAVLEEIRNDKNKKQESSKMARNSVLKKDPEIANAEVDENGMHQRVGPSPTWPSWPSTVSSAFTWKRILTTRPPDALPSGI